MFSYLRPVRRPCGRDRLRGNIGPREARHQFWKDPEHALFPESSGKSSHHGGKVIDCAREPRHGNHVERHPVVVHLTVVVLPGPEGRHQPSRVTSLETAL